jgi:hypothetical protein
MNDLKAPTPLRFARAVQDADGALVITGRTNEKRAGGCRPVFEYRERSSLSVAYMWAMMLSPNAEHLISVAPSIWRAKS